MAVPDRSTFESAYAGQAPWDVGKPQKAFLDMSDQVTGSVLDAGCGTGDNALYFAKRGCTVTGKDISFSAGGPKAWFMVVRRADKAGSAATPAR